MTANKIVNTLVTTRHSDDLCVPECKDGPSQGRPHRRLDLWAMRRSYTRPNTFGYEVKVSRSDFISDKKWSDYLPLCHEFYFVTPWKLVAPEECPAEAGLIWVSQNLSRCYVKKKASHRDIPLPEGLVTYVLMSRAKICHSDDPTEKTAAIRHWVENKLELKDLGYRIAERVAREVSRIRSENEALRVENESLREIKEFWIQELGCHEVDLKYRYRNIRTQNETKRKQLHAQEAPGIGKLLGDIDRSLRQVADAREELRLLKKELEP